MNNDLETFNYFVDDLVSSDVNLLKNELDLLLMQYLFNSIDLVLLKNTDSDEDSSVAVQILTMKYFYDKFWVPIFGAILSKFVFLIEGKQKKVVKTNKPNFNRKI